MQIEIRNLTKTFGLFFHVIYAAFIIVNVIIVIVDVNYVSSIIIIKC